MPEFMDHMPGDGVIILGFKVKSKKLVDVFEFGCTINGIFMVIHLADIVCLFFVIFITDFADDFFKQVLKCNESGNGTVFIKYHGHTDGILLHIHHQIRNSLEFIGEIWPTKNLAN